MAQIIAFDELKTDYKNPIDQCASLNPLVLPEYILHCIISLLFLVAGEWLSLVLNLPLLAYHIHRSIINKQQTGTKTYFLYVSCSKSTECFAGICTDL